MGNRIIHILLFALLSVTGVFLRLDDSKAEEILLAAGTLYDGVTIFDDRQMRRIIGIRPGDPASPKAIDLARERLRRSYRREGYPFAQVSISTVARESPGQVMVKVEVDEGRLVRISDIVIEGELPKDVQFLFERLQSRAAGAAASGSNRRTLRQELLFALRREGYLQASVDVDEFRFDEQAEAIPLVVRIETHEPIELQFIGNTVLLAEDLLAPLKLDTRTVPFTASALRKLVQEINALYQAQGYYFANATLEEGEVLGVRTIYRIFISEGEETAVYSISVAGNNKVSSRQVRSLIQSTERGSWLTRVFQPGFAEKRVIDADVQRITDFYQASGFPNARVAAEVIPRPDGLLEILFKIDEGEEVIINTVDVQWEGGRPSEIPEDEVSNLLAPLKGTPADLGKLEESRFALETLLQNRGFDNGSVDLAGGAKGQHEFIIRPGEQHQIGEILIHGLFYTDEQIVRESIGLEPGMLIRTSELRRAEQALFRLGLFHRVSVTAAPSSQGQAIRNIVIEVFERDTGSIELGVTLDSEDGLHLLGELGQRNLFGSGNSLVLSINGAQRSGNQLLDAGTARALFVVPEPDSIDFLAEAYSQYSIQLFNPYSFDKTGISLGFRTPQNKSLRGSVRWLPFSERLYDVERDVIIGPRDVDSTFYSYFRGDLEWDKRDDFADPHKGLRSRIEAQISSRLWGGEADVASAQVQESYYLPLSSRLVWLNTVAGSVVRAFGDDDVVPLSQRIFLGGRDSLRGFTRYAVGPRGDLLSIVGGDTSVRHTTELQYLLTDNVVGVAFLDYGVSVLKQKGTFDGDALSIALNDLRYSPGFGVRYKTPIGPIRLEFGFALDREFGERPVRVIIAVGNPY